MITLMILVMNHLALQAFMEHEKSDAEFKHRTGLITVDKPSSFNGYGCFLLFSIPVDAYLIWEFLTRLT